MRLLFVRHGESEANVDRIFSNRGWNHPLTPTGREQARALAERLADQDVIGVLSSPLRRAIETAEVLAARLSVPLLSEPALIEHDVGELEGMAYDEGWDRFMEVVRRWEQGELDARMPSGESRRDLDDRFASLIGRMVSEFGSRPGAMVMVSHAGLLGCVLPSVLANVAPVFAARHALEFTAVVEADLTSGRLRCVQWGDTPID